MPPLPLLLNENEANHLAKYDQFWENPSGTPIMWIGLLYAMMCLSVQYQRFSPNEARRLQGLDLDAENLVRVYREKIVQCLVLGGYTNGPAYTVETLLLYLFVEYLGKKWSGNNNWVLMGIIVRIALRMGYHRDGSHFLSTLSPFQAEMRRRTWTIIVQWDMLFALQFGLPRTVQQAHSDTAEPRNLTDDDLHPEMLELPPARPESTKTSPQYHVSKNRFLSILALVFDLSISPRPAPLIEVLSLDALLKNAYKTIFLAWQPVPTMANASPTANVRWSLLAPLSYRAEIILHRKYLTLGRSKPQYAYSRRTCVEASLLLLQHQWMLHLETQAGGRLCRHGWKFLGVLQQDFLLATAVMCLELAQSIDRATSASDTTQNRPSSDSPSPSPPSSNEKENFNETRDRVFHALSGSYIVWTQSSESSPEAQTMADALKALLGKAQQAGVGSALGNDTGWGSEKAPLTLSDENLNTAFQLPETSVEQYLRPPSFMLGIAGPILREDTYPGIGHFPI